MSFHDTSPLIANFGALLHDLHAPAAMAHPICGAFQLTHLYLHETHEGPVRAREHRHDVYHIVIFEQADNTFLLNRRVRRSHRGLCVLTHPNDHHCFPPRNKGRTVYHALTLQFADMTAPPPVLDILTHYTGIPLGGAPLAFDLPESAMLRLPGLLAAIRSTLPPQTEIAAGRLHHAILGLMQFVAEQLVAAMDATPLLELTPAETAHRYLERHYATRTSMAELAREAGVTPAHLGRVFQKCYGISPARYRDRLRIEAARNLLCNSDLLVKTIAYELGYPDTSTFSKAFRRHTGMSPATCRQS